MRKFPISRVTEASVPKTWALGSVGMKFSRLMQLFIISEYAISMSWKFENKFSNVDIWYCLWRVIFLVNANNQRWARCWTLVFAHAAMLTCAARSFEKWRRRTCRPCIYHTNIYKGKILKMDCHKAGIGVGSGAHRCAGLQLCQFLRCATGAICCTPASLC